VRERKGGLRERGVREREGGRKKERGEGEREGGVRKEKEQMRKMWTRDT